MRRWCQGDQSAPRCRRGRCSSAVIVWLVLSVGYVPALYGQPASAANQRVAPYVAPSSAPPPALPSSATERVLELSLENAIRLALQNNLDIERGRLDPQIAHTQVERARAVFDPSVALTASLSHTKPLPQNQTLEFDRQTDTVTGVSIIRPFSKDVAVTPGSKQQSVTGG